VAAIMNNQIIRCGESFNGCIFKTIKNRVAETSKNRRTGRDSRNSKDENHMSSNLKVLKLEIEDTSKQFT